jgi:hypothetical protein
MLIILGFSQSGRENILNLPHLGLKKLSKTFGMLRLV